MEIAEQLKARQAELERDVVVIAFSGEEAGALGSGHFVKSPPAGIDTSSVVAMLNLDMVGRLRANRLSVFGTDSGEEWLPIVTGACERERVECTTGGDGYGASDQTSFYAAGIPVLHFFSGVHSDYHKPSDAPVTINAAGAAQVASIVGDVAMGVVERATKLTYKKMRPDTPRGDLRSFNASLGTVPDYAGPGMGKKGVLLSGVRPGGAAENAGMKRGDILVRLGKFDIGSVEDLMYALNSAKPGETVTATVVREEKPVKLEVTFQEGKRR
jgi:hypothetical protein